MSAVHKAPIDALHMPYIVPSENGSRGDVKWLLLSPPEKHEALTARARALSSVATASGAAVGGGVGVGGAADAVGPSSSRPPSTPATTKPSLYLNPFATSLPALSDGTTLASRGFLFEKEKAKGQYLSGDSNRAQKRTDSSSEGVAGAGAREAKEVNDARGDKSVDADADAEKNATAGSSLSLSALSVGDVEIASHITEQEAAPSPCLRVTSSRPFNFSAQRFTTEDLHDSTHSSALEYFPRPFISLNLDPFLMGVGGDDSWTACVHEEYLLPPAEYEFDLNFKFH